MFSQLFQLVFAQLANLRSRRWKIQKSQLGLLSFFVAKVANFAIILWNTRQDDDIDHFLLAMVIIMASMCFLNLFAQLVHFALPARRGPLRAFVNKLTL